MSKADDQDVMRVQLHDLLVRWSDKDGLTAIEAAELLDTSVAYVKILLGELRRAAPAAQNKFALVGEPDEDNPREYRYSYTLIAEAGDTQLQRCLKTLRTMSTSVKATASIFKSKQAIVDGPERRLHRLVESTCRSFAEDVDILVEELAELIEAKEEQAA